VHRSNTVTDRAVCFLGRFLPKLGGASAPPLFLSNRADSQGSGLAWWAPERGAGVTGLTSVSEQIVEAFSPARGEPASATRGTGHLSRQRLDQKAEVPLEVAE
jgi:hypothetical protein